LFKSLFVWISSNKYNANSFTDLTIATLVLLFVIKPLLLIPTKILLDLGVDLSNRYSYPNGLWIRINLDL